MAFGLVRSRLHVYSVHCTPTTLCAHKFYKLAKNSFNKFIGKSHKNRAFQAASVRTRVRLDTMHMCYDTCSPFNSAKNWFIRKSACIGICHDRKSSNNNNNNDKHIVAKIAALTVLGHAKLVARSYWFSVSRSSCVHFNSIIWKPLLSMLLLLLHFFLNHTLIAHRFQPILAYRLCCSTL